MHLGLVARVDGREHDGAVAHGEAVVVVGAAEDLEERLVLRRRLVVVAAVLVTVVVVAEHGASLRFRKLRASEEWRWGMGTG
jgi:hypothetical protein